MREIFASLFLLRPDRPGPNTPFTYLLKRATGNILLATKADISHLAPDLTAIGGVSAVLLGDRHHAQPHTEALARQLGAPLRCSEIEARALKKAGVNVDDPIPYRRHVLAPDLEVIPTPGHTPGALSYLWTHEGRRFLFVGDTIVPIDREWRYWVTTRNREEMRRTVQTLSDLSFDVILSNSFAATPVAWLEVDAASRLAMCRELDRCLAQ